MDDEPPSPGSSSSSDAEPDIEALQKAVRATNTLPAHIALIDALRQTAHLTELRQAIQTAANLYPLPESVWLNYLQDETTLATTPQARQHLLSLHTQALSDFSTPALHAKQLVFAASRLKDHEITQDVYQRYLDDAKHHGAGYNEHFKKLCEGLPLTDTIFHTRPSEATIFEKRVLETPQSKAGTADNTRVTAYSFYARFAESNPLFAISIYETALSETFFSPDLWKQYDQFLYNTDNPRREKLLRRACRVLPNQLDFWRRALTIAPVDQFLGLLQSVKPYVMKSHDLASACRLTKEAWNRFFALRCPEVASETVMGTLEFNVPESVEWASATCHAAGVLFACGDLVTAEKLMDDVVGIRGEVRWWLLYAGMVDVGKRRHVYERALRNVGSLEDVYVIRDAWEVFEISCGDDEVVRRMQEIADIVGIREGETMKTERRHGKPAKRKRSEKGKTELKEKSGQKRVSGRDKAAVNGVDKMEEDEKDSVKPDKGMDTGSATKEEGKSETEKRAGTGGVEPRTVFLSNLAFSITEDNLREEFSSAGVIKQIRLPRRNDGASKGIAYIEFGDEDGVEKAIKKHNQPVKGRAVWVRRSKPPARKRPPPATKRRGGGGGGSGGGRGGRGRRIAIHPSGDRDGDVVMDDRKGGLGQDDFRKMLK